MNILNLLSLHFLSQKSIHAKEGSRINQYAITYFQNGFILFGGWTENGESKTIARFDLATSNWSKIGDLKTGRHAHGVIYDGEVFLVIGGYGDRYTEKCILSGTDFNALVTYHSHES